MDGRRAYFWVVPANVMGSLDARGRRRRSPSCRSSRRFQKISGTVEPRRRSQGGLRDARLRGFNISFAYVDQAGVRRDFTGRVTGSRMEGSFRDDKGGEGRWSAPRSK